MRVGDYVDVLELINALNDTIVLKFLSSIGKYGRTYQIFRKYKDKIWFIVEVNEPNEFEIESFPKDWFVSLFNDVECT